MFRDCDEHFFFHVSGFPPLPGQKASTAEQGFVAALEAAGKLTSDDGAEEQDEEEEEKVDEVSCRHRMLLLTGTFRMFIQHLVLVVV